MNIQNLDGLIPINKDTGIISKDVERLIVKKFGKLKTGHIGTLDPLASGVLPLLVGNATKLQDYFDTVKVYSITVSLGKITDSWDIDGVVVSNKEFRNVREDDIKKAVSSFIGKIEQIPPIYSAVKYQGNPLYKYRLKPESIDTSKLKRQVYIHSIEIESIKLPDINLKVSCSKGTYMRSLAKDIGDILGTGGVLSRIDRLRSSGINKKDCFSLSDILESGDLSSFIIPINKISLNLDKLQLPEPYSLRLFNGMYQDIDRSFFMDHLLSKNHLDSLYYLLESDTSIGVIELDSKIEKDSDEGSSKVIRVRMRRKIC